MDVAQFFKGAGDRKEERTLYLSPDPDLLTAAQVASRARSGGTLADPSDEESAERAEASEKRQAAVESSWKFTVQEIPARQWEWLRRQHPPTAQQHKDSEAAGLQPPTFNTETFPHVAIAACLREAVNPEGDAIVPEPPKWDAEGELQIDGDAQSAALGAWDAFSLGVWKRLWNAVTEINGSAMASAQVQSFANGSAKTRSGAS